MRRPAASIAGLAALLGAGCAGASPSDPSRCATPELLASEVIPNPHNVLSAVVTIEALEADTVRVRFGVAAIDSATPAFPVKKGTAAVPLLGLLPSEEYTLRVEAWNGCGASFGPDLSLATGPLPADLPRYRAGGPAPSPGYVVFGAGSYGLVIDNTGRVVWYRRFEGGPGLNFQAQPNGRYAARPGGAADALAPWAEVDRLGNLTRTLSCARGLSPRFHDLIALPDGSWWTMCDETRVMNLSTKGGVADARVTGTVIQHLGRSGEILFEWNAFDHFAIEDLDPADRNGATVNWTHGNAIDLDTDGNLLASFRSLNEITRIDTRTGAVRWRMGGRANQFDFGGASMPPYFRQHGVRSTAAGRLMLLDNLGQPGGSRAEGYEYDETSRTVRQMGAYGEGAGVTALAGGTTQSLPEGRLLVSFGNGGAVEEYDASGNVVWRIDAPTGYVFRAQRIRSLYQPGLGDPR